MNKYEEAYYQLWVEVNTHHITSDGERIMRPFSHNHLLGILKELVEKATPKQPPNHDNEVCPTCNSKAVYGHPYTEYCCHCGQKLWL